MSELMSAYIVIGDIKYPLNIVTERDYKEIKVAQQGITAIPAFIYMDSNENFYILPKPTDNFKLHCFVERYEQIITTTDSCLE